MGCYLMAAGFLSAEDFGVVTGNDHHTVNTGAGLVFRVVRSNGDVDSIKWRGTELNSWKRASHIASGLGSKGTTTSVRTGDELAVVTARTSGSNGVVADFTHYYIVRKGDNTIYMATHAAKQPRVGELRWITRLQGDFFPNVPVESSLRDSSGSIESRDVFGMPDGSTRSKYYGNDQAKNLTMRGVTGPGRGVFMVYGNRESSSGGPFFRDIQTQSGSEAEVYNYMNSGHAQTEMKRSGVLYGPYALRFTDGEKPELPDMGFIESLNLIGQVPSSGRGRLAVLLKGMDSKHPYTVGFANPAAQYWAFADPANGGAICPGMKPGVYRMTVYKGELGIHTDNVRVTADRTVRLPDIALDKDPSRAAALWRIGDWDGTPLEFLNGKNISLMHPSDKRQKAWKCDTFTIGASSPSDFPSCQWMNVNSGQIVKFQLAAAQITDSVVRIGITTAHSAARPRIKVNSWNSRIPSPTDQSRSRALTIGTYRGNNKTLTFDVPASALVAGENTLEIGVVSGNGGDGFLSPGYAIDCVDMIPKPAVQQAVSRQ
jgi:rhamnogalacturonan endolyase